MSDDAVLLACEGPLARITLNRPRVLNAENPEWIAGLGAAVEAVAARPEIRVVLLGGAGRAFCAGMDREMLSREGMPPGFYEEQERVFAAIEALDAVSVAALHGYCLGGGLQLALACDLRVCAGDCKLGLPAGELGLFPGMAVFRLPRQVGFGHARLILLTGEWIPPEEALRLGLVDFLAPPERLEAEADRVVRLLLDGPRAAQAATKRLLRRGFDAAMPAVLAESRALLADCLASPENAAAREQWPARRPPSPGSSLGPQC
ncbi:MAG TPA: enoyl-CoA hydratase/isomerase family protein [Dehalococcoidia bacterium]|nr:enoyl-CoA hydratase/isomerase family protein [Dehalococcoidia bacterium]